MGGVSPGWYPDIERRHEMRYWNGAEWTEHVADHGKQSKDPIVPRYSEQLTETARRALGGESFVAATKCMVEGHAKRQSLGGGLFGAIGALTASSGSKKGHAMGGERLPKQLALGLSPTRLFAFPLSKFAGDAIMPPVAVVPDSQVMHVATRMKSTFLTRQLVLEIAFADGATISVETVAGHVESGEHLANQLRLRTEHN